MFSYEANNIHTINSKKNEDTEHVPSGEFQPEEMNILGEKRERTTMTTNWQINCRINLCVLV